MTVSPAELAHNRFRRFACMWAIVAATLLGSTVIAVLSLLHDSHYRSIESLTRHENRSAEILIRQDLAARLTAIDRLANRWTASGGTPRAVWEADAVRYLADMPGFQAIEWVDASQYVRWTVHQMGDKGRQGKDISHTEAARIIFAKPSENREPRFSKPFNFIHGALSILIYVSVRKNETFDGVMVGVLRLDPWLDAVLDSGDAKEYGTQVLIAGEQVYDRGYSGQSIDETLTSQRGFELRGLQLIIRTVATKELVSALGQQVSTLMLVFGLLLSALFGMFVHQSLYTRLRVRELRTANRQHTALMQNFQGMVYRTLDLEYPWPMQFVSEGAEALCGYKQVEIEQQRVLWGELIFPQDLEQVITAVRDAVNHDGTFKQEFRIRTKEDTEKWVWARGRCVTNPDTNRRDLEGFVSDITERKLAELRLFQEQAYSKSIIDTSLEAVVTFDTTGSIRSFNPAAEKIFNYSLAEIVGENICTLMPASYRDEYDDLRHRFIAGEAHIFDKPQSMSGQRKDGSIFPIQFSISEIEGQSQRMFVDLIRDVSSEQAAEAELRAQREQLAHVDRLHLLGEMATGIAHEINQPLTSISLFSQAGKRFAESGAFDRLPDIFDKLSTHSLRAGAIVEKIQTMTRQRDSEKTIVDCNTLIESIRQLAEAEARIHDIVINLELGSKLPLVAVDVVQIQQVILNLLRNGMEAMGSIHCRNGDAIVLKTCLLKNEDVEISVIDKGAGISEESCNEIFEPFWSSKDAGMGMGLSICRAIVVAHGGLMDFVNNQSGGATFFLKLPAAKQGEKNE